VSSERICEPPPNGLAFCPVPVRISPSAPTMAMALRPEPARSPLELA
jgi:hypothetical protein